MERICNRKAVSTGLLLLVICLLAYGCLWESSSGEDAFSRAMNQALQDSVPRHQIPGVAAAVRKPDGTIWRGAAGLADIEAGTPVHADMYFHIGSITKCFTATLFLQLVDKGWATLDDTLDKWLPGMVSNGSQITIRNLLQMRSGLDHYENDTTFVNFFLSDPRYVWSFSELLATCNRTLFNPNTQYDYNNMNYIIVGEIIKTILGQTYAQAIQERILDPLGMTNTSVPTTASMPEPYAHGYLYENGRVVDHSTTWDTSALGAAGSMISTVRDLLIWIEALMDGTLLTQAMHAEQFNFLSAGSGTAYGMGVAVRPDGMVGHAGDYNELYTGVIGRKNGYDYAVLAGGQAARGGAQSKASRVLTDLVTAVEESVMIADSNLKSRYMSRGAGKCVTSCIVNKMIDLHMVF